MLVAKVFSDQAASSPFRCTEAYSGDVGMQEAIELHLPVEQFEKLKVAEESERALITRLVGKITRKKPR